MWPTRFRCACADPKLNQPPCRWRIAPLERALVGLHHKPETPPTVSGWNATFSGGETRSIIPLNDSRAALPRSLPLKGSTAARMAVITAASSRVISCVRTEDSVTDTFLFLLPASFFVNSCETLASLITLPPTAIRCECPCARRMTTRTPSLEWHHGKFGPHPGHES